MSSSISRMASFSLYMRSTGHLDVLEDSPVGTDFPIISGSDVKVLDILDKESQKICTVSALSCS